MKRGFVKLPVVIAGALGAGFAASVFLNYVQHERAAQDEKQLQGQITDLQYQVNLDRQSKASPSPSPTPDASPSPSPTPTPVLDASTAPPTAANTCSPANFREDAKSSATLIAALPRGTVVTLGTAIVGSYRQVTYNGRNGYILKACLQ